MDLVELVIGAKSGRREDFAELVARFQHRIFAQALGRSGDRGEAEEITQETFVRAWRKLDDLREPAAFAGWLGQIASRVAADRGRDLARRRELGEAAASPSIGDPAAEGDEGSPELWGAVDALPADQREAFLLVHLEGLSYREVADQLGVPVSTVEGRVYTAKKSLREKVKP
jgi:RNA polymerase sigma-70 factor (ECF subfamily)